MQGASGIGVALVEEAEDLFESRMTLGGGPRAFDRAHVP
jgi:hypothetical protein